MGGKTMTTQCIACQECCKSAPGAAMPSDFGAPDRRVMRARLRDALRSGGWAVDWWEGDAKERPRSQRARSYFVRPRTAYDLPGLLNPSWGGQCTFLRSWGCAIYPSRPSECRGLVPQGKECVVLHSDKQTA